jgi:hypothetical protein
VGPAADMPLYMTDGNAIRERKKRNETKRRGGKKREGERVKGK